MRMMEHLQLTNRMMDLKCCRKLGSSFLTVEMVQVVTRRILV